MLIDAVTIGNANLKCLNINIDIFVKLDVYGMYLRVACYFEVTPYVMTNEEILQAVRQVERLEGMTVNERLYVADL